MKLLISILLTFVLSACAVLAASSPGAKEAAEGLRVQVQADEAFLLDIATKVKDGTLTAADALPLVIEAQGRINATRAAIADAEAAGATATDALVYGGIGGTVARSALHLLPVAATAFPGIPFLPLLSQLASLVLAGSSTAGIAKKKKK